MVTLLVVVLFLQADHQGEGGVFALGSLLLGMSGSLMIYTGLSPCACRQEGRPAELGPPDSNCHMHLRSRCEPSLAN